MRGEELARFHRGDEGLFRELVDTHSPRLLVVARSFATQTQEAQDLVQETWLRAWARRSTYSGRGPILSWLYSVCRSVCLSKVRVAKGLIGVGATHDGSVRRDPAGLADLAAAELGSGEAELPDAASARVEMSRAVRQALMELPERQRAVVICRILEGRSTRETAEVLGCAEGTVKASLHHALRALEPHLRSWAPETENARELRDR